MELLTAAQMRAIERAAIDSGAVTGLELMERAGRGVVDAIFEEWPDLGRAPRAGRDEGARRAAVLCGPGNNGGDGFVVARLLKERGWAVSVFLHGDPGRLPPDARATCERWRALGAVVPHDDDDFRLDPDTWDCGTVMVDAILGIGLSRDVEGLHRFGRLTRNSEWRLPPEARRRRLPGCRVVAVDVPTGLDADTGFARRAPHPDGGDIAAALTVTFHRAKVGHFLGDGPRLCGRLAVKDIGL